MPSTLEAVDVFLHAKILYTLGKASNAGGVANLSLVHKVPLHLSWTYEEVDTKLHAVMKQIHQACVFDGKEADGSINDVKGANIAGFVKVADAMLAQGVL